MREFIEAVRAQPCLWSPVDPDYREPRSKHLAWQCVVDKCKSKEISSIQAAKAEWKKLRDNHRDALKRAKLGKNKLLPAHITTWKYAKHMQFLEPHMKYRITEHIELEPLDRDLSLPKQDLSLPLTNPHNKAQKLPKNEEHHEDEDSKPDEDDALASFFNCMLKSTREMPQYLQTHVKKKIFAVIIEAEEQMSQEPKVGNHQQIDICMSVVKGEPCSDDDLV